MGTYVQGIVDAIRKDGAGLQMNRTWYAGLDKGSMERLGIYKGSNVGFEWTQNDRWINIDESTIQVFGGQQPQGGAPQQYQQPQQYTQPQQAAPQQRPPQQGANSQPAPQQRQYKTSEPTDDVTLCRQRSIIRQSSIDHATVAYVGRGIAKSVSNEQIANDIIGIARDFEAYASGDDDAELARQATLDPNSG